MTNLPDDWNEHYRTCSHCKGTYHPSGTVECDCKPCSHEMSIWIIGQGYKLVDCNGIEGRCDTHTCSRCGEEDVLTINAPNEQLVCELCYEELGYEEY